MAKMIDQDNSECILQIQKRLIGAEVVDIKIGYSTIIEVYNHNKEYYYISLGNSEAFIENKSSSIIADEIESKLVLAKFYKEKIESLNIDNDGNLEIEFAQSHNKIITKSNSSYEAWEINGLNGFKIVCAVGGGLVCWY
jgi:hypothetical protein